MFARNYSFYLQEMGNFSVTFNGAPSLSSAIAWCQKTINHLAPHRTIRWDCVRASLVEERSFLCDVPRLRASLFEVDEMEILYAYDTGGALRSVRVAHQYDYVMAKNMTQTLDRVRGLLGSFKISHYHETVYQRCTHLPAFVDNVHIEQEEQRDCSVAR